MRRPLTIRRSRRPRAVSAAAQSTLSSDETQKAQDCAGSGASSPACSSDTQKVTQDQTQLTQAQQQLASAQNAATRDHDQNQAKVAVRRDDPHR